MNEVRKEERGLSRKGREGRKGMKEGREGRTIGKEYIKK